MGDVSWWPGKGWLSPWHCSVCPRLLLLLISSDVAGTTVVLPSRPYTTTPVTTASTSVPCHLPSSYQWHHSEKDILVTLLPLATLHKYISWKSENLTGHLFDRDGCISIRRSGLCVSYIWATSICNQIEHCVLMVTISAQHQEEVLLDWEVVNIITSSLWEVTLTTLMSIRFWYWNHQQQWGWLGWWAGSRERANWYNIIKWADRSHLCQQTVSTLCMWPGRLSGLF